MTMRWRLLDHDNSRAAMPRFRFSRSALQILEAGQEQLVCLLSEGESRDDQPSDETDECRDYGFFAPRRRASSFHPANDPKLSDCGGRRSLCGKAAGAGLRAGAQAVTPGAVRCSAWFGAVRASIRVRSHFFKLLHSEWSKLPGDKSSLVCGVEHKAGSNLWNALLNPYAIYIARGQESSRTSENPLVGDADGAIMASSDKVNRSEARPLPMTWRATASGPTGRPECVVGPTKPASGPRMPRHIGQVAPGKELIETGRAKKHELQTSLQRAHEICAIGENRPTRAGSNSESDQ